MQKFEITKELETKLAAANSPEEAVSIFAEAGLDITAEQLETLAAANTQEGELSEDALDNVAGGILSAIGGRISFDPNKLIIVGPGGRRPDFRNLILRWFRK